VTKQSETPLGDFHINDFFFPFSHNTGRTQLSVFPICLWPFQTEHFGNHPYFRDHDSELDKAGEAEGEGMKLEADVDIGKSSLPYL